MIRAALRYRRGQAALLALVSALVVGCAAFAPLYERALERALLLTALERTPEAATAITLNGTRQNGRTIDAATVRGALPSGLAAQVDPGTEVWSGNLVVFGVSGDYRVPLRATPDPCRGVQVVSGRCPSAAYEVMVTQAEAQVQSWAPGSVISGHEVRPSVAKVPPFRAPLTIVGTFRQERDTRPWGGLELGGKAGTTLPGVDPIPLMDTLVTVPATFADQPQGDARTVVGWTQVAIDVRYLLARDRIDLEALPAIPAALADATSAALRSTPSISVRSALGELASDVAEGQRQARVIVPLLVAQLALLAVVVLGLVAGSAVEQRRPEVALARLRGAGAGGARRLLLGELGSAVLLGAPVGLALAIVAMTIVRRVWLVEGVPFEVPASALLAAVLGVLAGLVAVLVAIRPAVREPVASLLRRVPPRTRGGVLTVVDALVIGISLAGVLALASGNLSGPLALATPALLALAVGLLLAHLIVPVAARIGRTSTRRGDVAAAVSALQVARRPAVRRIVTIITVATALSVFAADALVVGSRNRDWRARTEIGAAAVLRTDATDPAALMATVKRVDPTGGAATPVIAVRQGSSDAKMTMAVIPGEFEQVADLPVRREAFDLARIATAPPPAPTVTGDRLVVQVKPALAVRAPGGVPPTMPVPLTIRLRTSKGALVTVPVGLVPVGPADPITLTSDVDCQTGCPILGIGIDRGLGDNRTIRGSLVVSGLTAGSGVAEIGRPGLWSGVGQVGQDLIPYAVAAPSTDPRALTIEVQSERVGVGLRSTSVSAALPALVVGGLPPGATPGQPFQGAGIDGLAVDLQSVGDAPYAPGGGANVAIVNLPSLLSRGREISSLGSAEVYVRDVALIEPLTTALQRNGIGVRTVTRTQDRLALYEASASAWGLRLALVVGALAVLMAGLVLVLVAATAWRGRARDYAALRMAGIPERTLRRASIREQGVVVLVATLVGAGCGVLAGRLALPIVPLFNTASPTYQPDLSVAIGPVAVAALGTAIALLAVAGLVGLRLVGRAGLERLRETL